MAAWPTLPKPLIGTYQESTPDNLIRSSTDKGPAKVRRRSTANVRPIGFNLLLTPAQVVTLETFHNVTLEGGAGEFTYTHPRTGASVTARFSAPPTYSDVNGMNFRAEIQLEIMP